VQEGIEHLREKYASPFSSLLEEYTAVGNGENSLRAAPGQFARVSEQLKNLEVARDRADRSWEQQLASFGAVFST